MLKKLISTSQKLAKLKTDSARLLYTWLVPHLDIEGRFSADPCIVKGYVVPRLKMTPRKIAEYLEDMAKNGLIILYEIDGDKFLQLKKFKNFQTLREDRESKSQIPAPPRDAITTPGARQEHASTSKVNESKVKERKRAIELLKEIIDYFNETTSQKRSYTCDETNKLINGRLDEGKTFKDFKHVIDTKTAQWFNDTKMRKFIRPSTLFRPANFEDYLNEPYETPKVKLKTGQVGVSRQKKTKYPLEFIASVYAALHKQGKDGHQYADLLFALTDAQAKAAAKKYKDNPAGFIKALEENA